MPTILFAPIQGYTEAFYRQAHTSVFHGIHEYYAPFLRLEKGIPRAKELRDTEKTDSRLVPQILAKEYEEAHRLISALAQQGQKRIDLNFGCPFPKITGHGYGAGILNDPEKITSLLNVTKQFPFIEFSVKMRTGATSKEECLHLLPILNSIPLKQIVLHPRTGIQQYQGMPDRDVFRKFSNECRHPVFYNGDIKNTEEFLRLTEEFPTLPGVMIGRGLLENPFLADLLSGKSYSQIAMIQFHEAILKNLTGIQDVLQKIKTVWDFLLPDANTHLRKKIKKSRTLEEYREHTETLLLTYPAEKMF